MIYLIDDVLKRGFCATYRKNYQRLLLRKLWTQRAQGCPENVYKTSNFLSARRPTLVSGERPKDAFFRRLKVAIFGRPKDVFCWSKVKVFRTFIQNVQQTSYFIRLQDVLIQSKYTFKSYINVA